MKKYFLIWVLVFLSPSIFAQDLGDILGKFGMNTASPESSYSFDGNFIQRITMTDRKGKETSMDSQYFFSKKEAIVGSKIIDTNNPDMKKMLDMVEMGIFDLDEMVAFSFTNMGDRKMVSSMNLKDDRFIQELENDEQGKYTFTKTDKTKTIMGQVCDGYEFKEEKSKSKDETTIWISRNAVPQIASLGRNMGKAFNSKIMGKKSKNYMAYNVHPEMVKIAKQGRAMLGFTMDQGKKGKAEMEIVKINMNEKYTFKTAGYDSLF